MICGHYEINRDNTRKKTAEFFLNEKNSNIGVPFKKHDSTPVEHNHLDNYYISNHIHPCTVFITSSLLVYMILNGNGHNMVTFLLRSAMPSANRCQ